MKKDFILPNYDNSILNISATLASFLGCPNNHTKLKVVEDELKNNYKNVVFICFDGLGIYPINKNLDNDSILKKSICQTVLSTFPSTTTNATTSLLNIQYPLEHGWLGWSLNYPEINKNINIFRETDSWTNEKVELTTTPLGKLNYYFNNTKSEYKVTSLFPEYVDVQNEDINIVYETQNELFENIKNICNSEGKQFIYAYYPEPDKTMHKYGVTSKEAKEIITSLSNAVEKLKDETHSTLFIISADHGQIDVEGYIDLYKDEEIMNLLEIYPYLEPRATAFKVIKGKEEDFERIFNSKYSEDFVLYKTKDLIDKGYFGETGDKGYLLGDYIAIGTYTHKIFIMTPVSKQHKGHHTSLTEEMEVPLILIKN